MSTPTVQSLLQAAAARGIEPVDAELLLGHALGRGRTWLYAHRTDAVESGGARLFEALCERRAAGEPAAYLTGRRGFWSFDLQVTSDTLIPRPETERLVELALDRLPVDRDLHLADLGTGSGAIALALAHERPRARVVAVDVSAGALAVARANAAGLRLANVECREGDWLDPLAGERFDLIASNPPYIAEGDPHLDALRYEPAPALSSGRDGLDAIRLIATRAPAHLVAGGWLLFEHGLDQGEAVREILRGAGFDTVATDRDLEDRDRVTSGRWRG